MRGLPTDPAPNTSAQAAKAAAEERNRRVEVAFLEGIRSRLPTHPAVVETLGCLYTEMGEYQEGLKADQQMVEMEPHSPIAWYNLACSFSLTQQTNAAFSALEKAISLGYNDAEWMQEDDDFRPIRTDPRFVRLLAQMLARKA